MGLYVSKETELPILKGIGMGRSSKEPQAAGGSPLL